VAYSNEPTQEEMAISSPFKTCTLQASCIFSRKPKHLEAFQMFFQKKHSCRNNMTYSAVLQQISQGHGISSLSGDSGRTQ